MIFLSFYSNIYSGSKICCFALDDIFIRKSGIHIAAWWWDSFPPNLTTCRGCETYINQEISCNSEIWLPIAKSKRYKGHDIRNFFILGCTLRNRWTSIIHVMASSNGNIFRVTDHLWSPVNSPHKGQWRGALMFPLICAWINVWVNNREAGDLKRHHVHYDVIVMS